MAYHKMHGEDDDQPKDNKVYKEVLGMLEGDLLKTKADREEAKGKHGEAQFGKTLATEMESNVCPICMDLMIPPKNKPMLLFPCGHTFCSHCLAIAEKTSGKKKCSLCKNTYSHCAVNIALQNLICIFTDNKQLLEAEAADKKNAAQVEDEQEAFYQEKLAQLTARLNLLSESSRESARAIRHAEEEVHSSRAAEKIMLRELVEAEDELEIAMRKVDLVKSELATIRERQEKSEARLLDERERLALVTETLQGLQEERVKVAILLNAQK